ncbi:MAG: shikimate kinase [Chitinophagaceae bacterium]|nr:MAG: shikimate kinase [Chitinophagaceae bacterium]
MKIYLNGFMGAGKTHWGRQLGKRLQIPFFDLDEQVVNSEGKSINEIFAAEGEEGFRMKEKEVLHLITESHDSFIMACGGGSPCYFNNIEFMNDRGLTIWINTPTTVLFERLVKERDHRPLLRSLDDQQLKAFIQKKISDRKIYYQQCQVIIDDENITPEQFIETIFHA